MKLRILTGLLLAAMTSLPCQAMHRARRIMGHVTPAVAAQSAVVRVAPQPVSAAAPDAEQEAKIKADVAALLDDLTSDVHPLLKAYYNNDFESFKKLVAGSTDIKADIAATRDSKHKTVLDYAIAEERWDIIKACIDKGIVFDDIVLLKMLGKENAPRWIVDLLLANVPGSKRQEDFMEAISHPYFIDVIKGYLKLPGIDSNARCKNGNPILFEVVRFWSLEEVQLLVAHGADINAIDPNGLTFLMYAIKRRSDKEVIECIVKLPGVNVNAQDNNGLTALHWAALPYIKREYVTALIQAGADINATDQNGMTLLMYAIKRHEVKETIEFLLKLPGINVNAEDRNGTTALHWAIEHLYNDGAIRLIKAGADLNKVSFLDLMQSKKIVTYLIKTPGLINVNRGCGLYGNTLLMTAILVNDKDMVRYLIASGADINARNKQGETALMKAAQYRRKELLVYLLALGADVNAKNHDGYTALMIANIQDYDYNIQDYDYNIQDYIIRGMLRAAHVKACAKHRVSRIMGHLQETAHAVAVPSRVECGEIVL